MQFYEWKWLEAKYMAHTAFNRPEDIFNEYSARWIPEVHYFYNNFTLICKNDIYTELQK